MENQVIAPALTDEERRFLFDQRNSEHFRVFAKAITWQYSLEAAKLVSLTSTDLPRAQGVLQGLLSARGVILAMAHSANPDMEKPAAQRQRPVAPQLVNSK